MTNFSPPTVRFHDGVYVLELGPEYSNLYENLLDNLAVLPLLAESAQPARVVLDMSNVNVIGSALIGQFVATSRKLQARDGSFALTHVNKFCQTAINLTKLNSFLTTYESTGSALEAMAAPRPA